MRPNLTMVAGTVRGFPVRRSSAPLLFHVLLATSALDGCTLVEEPETPPTIATFQIDATLYANGCGYGALQLPSYQQLVGTLGGYAGELAQWTWAGQSRAAAGTASSTGTYTFSSLSQFNDIIAPDPSIDYPGCSIQRRDELTVTIRPVPLRPEDAGSGDASIVDGGADDAGMDGGADGGVTSYTLTGTLVTDVVPTAGSDCTPLLGANGGPWLAIPCQARIDLAGTQQ